jgi:hypothetical protein
MLQHALAPEGVAGVEGQEKTLRIMYSGTR